MFLLINLQVFINIYLSFNIYVSFHLSTYYENRYQLYYILHIYIMYIPIFINHNICIHFFLFYLIKISITEPFNSFCLPGRQGRVKRNNIWTPSLVRSNSLQVFRSVIRSIYLIKLFRYDQVHIL